jgi:hypothetical protein
MDKQELIQRSLRALEEFSRLPPEEQLRQLIVGGTINEKGEVLLGRGETDGQRPENNQADDTPGK